MCERIRLCKNVCPGKPKGCPRGKRTCTARGTRTLRVIAGTMVTDIVGTPASSIALWINPTDWWHAPQPIDREDDIRVATVTSRPGLVYRFVNSLTPRAARW